ncbi:MAG TPA: endonuclease/exonuclease/phosphatase family protein [Roseiflexaceae bacterium]|nr:endonuclease/exonuclease/phosphatase family protein [Roseiflexaceae bacterium]
MQAMPRAASRVLAGAASIYCVTISLLALLWAIGLRGTWWLDLAKIFALYLFAPLPLLLLAALMARGWRRRSLVAGPVVAFLAIFGARFIPPLSEAPPGVPLRIMTFNMHYALAEPDLAGLIEFVRAQDADIVAFQELSFPAADALRRQLGSQYPYQELSPAEAYTGVGVISRYPLRALAYRKLVPGKLLELDVGGAPITLVNASLTAPDIQTRSLPLARSVRLIKAYDTVDRAYEIATLLDIAEDMPGPMVLVGDFNMADHEPDYGQLADHFDDAFRETNAGFGFTFPDKTPVLPSPLPLVRIDYVWSRAGVRPASARVVCGSGVSDHCALVAELRVGT